MKKWEAVIFDMDGTLFDTETISMKAWKRVGEKLHLPTSDTFILSLIGRTRKDQQVIFDTYMPKGWPQEEACRLHTLYKKEEKQQNGVPLMGDVKGLLEMVKNKGYRIAMATSASAEDVEFNLHHAGIAPYFEIIVSEEMISQGKPAPDVYLKTAEKLGVEPQNCLVVEDSLNGVRSAYRANTNVVMIPDKIPPTKEIEPMCDYILNSLDELKKMI
ncbi:HAD family phosphatase [Erysipelotrichaceae bacterium AF15-26LB]|mgnify:FL=1|nr:HAD family phosphatase [[Clostridium] innocuum]RJV88036.1 HAD family phosphatase [Erysipelotrichaceae bacterium AF15-26LB]RJV89817.1 HAD family phosphatase [Erysipelotrichaceae bacterium AF19-24AC]